MNDTRQSRRRQEPPLLDIALDYAGRGWGVFPLWSVRDGVCTCRKRGRCTYPGKHPRSRAGFLDAITDPQEIRRRWKWESANIGIATGAASGLLVIDIDPRHGGDVTIKALIAELGKLPPAPRVRTGGGGWHVLFLHPGRHITSRNGAAAGIDIKADGGYIVAPPSKHISGKCYQWEVDPESVELPSLPQSWLDWIENPPLYREHREDGEYLGVQMITETTEAITSMESVENNDGPVDLEQLVLKHLPAGPGRRNRQVFELARALRAVPHLADAGGKDIDQLEPHVRIWHNEGVRRGLIATEPFEETWIDFLRAWPKVKFPKGQEPMAAIFARATEEPLPEVAKKYQDHQGLQLLVAICRELQRAAGQGPFFLACRTAGKLLNVSHTQAHGWLFLLQHDEVIELVEKGEQSKRRASRYRYMGG